LARLTEDYPEFTSRAAEVIAVGPDAPGAFGRYWRAQQIPFIGIPDPQHKVARLYRQEVNLFKLGRMPLVAVVDGKGFVRYVHRADSMSDIPDNGVLLEVVDCIQAAVPKSAKPTEPGPRY
jgi:peroxiredoxin Q/BCP